MRRILPPVAHAGAKDHDIKCPHESGPEGTKGREFSCHSCLGRDWDNCETGQTCCKTACFKIEDKKHAIIAKGCWAEQTDDIKQVPKDDSARSYKTDVQLPWANNELLGGRASGGDVFTDRPDMCRHGALLHEFILQRGIPASRLGDVVVGVIISHDVGAELRRHLL
jgi:hypothetical protein